MEDAQVETMDVGVGQNFSNFFWATFVSVYMYKPPKTSEQDEEQQHIWHI